MQWSSRPCQSLQQKLTAATCQTVSSDWRRFLYDSISLCEHWAVICSHTVVISWICGLDSTDSQSEFRFRSTAAEMTRSIRLTATYFVKQQFGRLPRFLQVPAEIIINPSTSWTAQRDCLPHTDRLWCRRLSHRWTGTWYWKKEIKAQFKNDFKNCF